jgi:hypothetical protein
MFLDSEGGRGASSKPIDLKSTCRFELQWWETLPHEASWGGAGERARQGQGQGSPSLCRSWIGPVRHTETSPSGRGWTVQTL